MIKPFRQDYPLTQGWGENPATYAQFGLKGHNGLDYATPNDTDILAPHQGKIIEVGFDPSGYGNYIKIENSGEGSVLAHLRQSLVQVGDNVMEGALIAKSDNTGFSTGPHLHWGYYRIPRNRQDGYLGFINQLPLITNTSPVIDYKKLYEESLKKIEDLKATETRLKEEAKRLQKEMADKLALAEQTAKAKLQDFKNKIISLINSYV